MNLNATFRARVTGLNTTGKTNKLPLELDAEISAEALLSIMKMKGQTVFVTIGDPQVSMDFGDEDDDKGPTFTSEPIKYQTDGSGVVVHMFNKKDGEKQEDQEPGMFDTPGEIQVEGEEKSDTTGQEEDDMPEAAEEYDGEEEERQVDYSDPYAGVPEPPSDKEIEEYILSGKAPHFEDIKFDFPELLDKKRKLGSWKKVAMQTGDSIGHLTRSFKEYKARVADQMRSGGDIA